MVSADRSSHSSDEWLSSRGPWARWEMHKETLPEEQIFISTAVGQQGQIGRKVKMESFKENPR